MPDLASISCLTEWSLQIWNVKTDTQITNRKSTTPRHIKAFTLRLGGYHTIWPFSVGLCEGWMEFLVVILVFMLLFNRVLTLFQWLWWWELLLCCKPHAMIVIVSSNGLNVIWLQSLLIRCGFYARLLCSLFWFAVVFFPNIVHILRLV